MNHPPPDDLLQLKQEADREQSFWQAHHQEFAQKYPDQFVAVYDGHVVAVSDDPVRLVKLIGLTSSRLRTNGGSCDSRLLRHPRVLARATLDPL
jgi:hypothetical protein